MSELFWRASRLGGPQTDRQPAITDGGPSSIYLQAMATVATLFEYVDIARLIATRDRISADSTNGILAGILPQTAYREYLRFLTIKILSSDTPASNLSPSWYIDQLWHSHILDTEAYARVRAKWPGRLEHDPVPAGGVQGQRVRLLRTLQKYEEFFQQSPLREATVVIWSDEGQVIASKPDPGWDSDQSDLQEAETHAALDPPFAGSPSFPIHIGDGYEGAVVTLMVSSQMKVAELKLKYQEAHNWPVRSQRLLFEGTLLRDEQSLGEYGIKSEATLEQEELFC